MPLPTPLDRRGLLTRAGLGLAAGLGWSAAASARSHGVPPSAAAPGTASAAAASLADLGVTLTPGGADCTAALQAAIDQASDRGIGLRLSPGTYVIGRPVVLRPGTILAGGLGATRLVFKSGAGLVAQRAAGVRLEDLILDGQKQPLDPASPLDALVTLIACAGVRLARLEVRDGSGDGLTLRDSSGAITACDIHGLRRAGVSVLDGAGFDISHNHVRDCGDNGILAWTSKPAGLAALITANRIERIAARSGGTGQNGNGINVFRASGVLVANNHISDCAYSAIRGNAASNIQMVANNCARLGEVALYAEFGFEGALISNNIVDTAASGISVTNFNEGGRLAVVQGNLIRNLSRREHEPEDKRGEGISVEADSVVSSNVIEGAPTAGIAIGWGRHMRDVTATGNLIRDSRIGIAVQAGQGGEPGKAAGLLGALTGGSSGAFAAGTVLLANNRISGARDGAIRTLRLAEPFGADLARAPPSPFAHIVISGNVAG